VASRSLNKVTLIGNVGQDPEIRTTTGGGRVANFSLATSRVWNGPSGDRQEKTEWHKCVVWNSKVTSLADVVEKYVHKGTQLYVEGRIEYRTYQDKENQTRYVTEINVRELMLLGSRGGAGGGNGESEGAERSVRSARAPRSVGSGDGGGRDDEGKSDEFGDIPGALADEDDDLPF
jgi:single-strand DNA-binding protein